jgi:hypothetical protein
MAKMVARLLLQQLFAFDSNTLKAAKKDTQKQPFPLFKVLHF